MKKIYLEINSERINVRDFRIGERKAVFAEALPLMHALRDLMFERNGSPPFHRLNTVFEEHLDAYFALLVRACGRDRAWIEGLREYEAVRLQRAFLAASVRLWRWTLSVELDDYLARTGRAGQVLEA